MSGLGLLRAGVYTFLLVMLRTNPPLALIGYKMVGDEGLEPPTLSV